MIAVPILIGKLIALTSNLFAVGSGSTWPGHVALSINRNFVKDIIKKNNNIKVILIAGTNGKTTTGKLLQTILEKNGNRVFQNSAGANLLNGIASALIKNAGATGKINYDYAIFEIDENALPTLLDSLTPQSIIILNLFRDQLDRYGEINIIADKWKMALSTLSQKTLLILNADDPKVAYLGNDVKNKTCYFGLSGKNQIIDHASDSTYCPNCDEKLIYKNITFSHLGKWLCSGCKLKRPKTNIETYNFYPLAGSYNKYNFHSAVLTAKSLGVSDETIKMALENFKPAFGRQEVIRYRNKKIQIFLSKNPASLNQSLQTIKKLNAKHVMIVLNDRIPDGRDVSWIWDVDFENCIKDFTSISVSGDRMYDMALRLEYAEKKNVLPYEDLKNGIKQEIASLPDNETLFILPTYSAMLDLRKIITGKALL